MDDTQRLALELKRARDLQAAFLRRDLPPVPGIETAVICEPAFELTGDFFDCTPLALYEVGLFIADVRGKGIAAAIVQGMVRALFHAEAPKHDTPGPVLRALNHLMYQDLEPMPVARYRELSERGQKMCLYLVAATSLTGPLPRPEPIP